MIFNFIFSQNKSILHLLILMTFLLLFSCDKESINDPVAEESVDEPAEEVVIISGILEECLFYIHRSLFFSFSC